MNFNRLTDIAYALKPPNYEYKCWHVTFALRKSRILSIGVNNHTKTHPRNLKLPHIDEETGLHYGANANIHSELACLLKLGIEDCSAITFVNARIDRNGELNMAIPCNGCNTMLKQVGFKRIYYTNKKGLFEELCM